MQVTTMLYNSLITSGEMSVMITEEGTVYGNK